MKEHVIAFTMTKNRENQPNQKLDKFTHDNFSHSKVFLKVVAMKMWLLNERFKNSPAAIHFMKRL